MSDALAAKCLQCGRSFPSEEELEGHECMNEELREGGVAASMSVSKTDDLGSSPSPPAPPGPPPYEWREDCKCSACTAVSLAKLNEKVKVEQPQAGGSLRV